VAVDNFLGVDRLVMHRRVDVFVPDHELGDVRGHPVHDGVGDEEPAQVVRAEDQGLAAGVGDSGVAEGIFDMSRMAASVIGRFSTRRRRWNNSGAGGFQMRSCRS
jgi:hypothetical protein